MFLMRMKTQVCTCHAKSTLPNGDGTSRWNTYKGPIAEAIFWNAAPGNPSPEQKKTPACMPQLLPSRWFGRILAHFPRAKRERLIFYTIYLKQIVPGRFCVWCGFRVLCFVFCVLWTANLKGVYNIVKFKWPLYWGSLETLSLNESNNKYYQASQERIGFEN